MPPDILPALVGFCVASSGTPGPNNMMLLSSGASFGYRRTIPHMLGITLGCAAMVMLLGLGLAGTVARTPWLYLTLHWVSTLYLLWLAWRIATATGLGTQRSGDRPQSLLGAAAFQWVNPKAWAMVLGAVTSFARPDHLLADVLVIAGTLALVGFPCISAWAGGGVAVKRVLQRPGALRAFNIGMAILLVLSLIPGLLPAR